MLSTNAYIKNYLSLVSTIDHSIGKVKYFKLKEKNFSYRVVKNSSSKNVPLLFIHGWGSSMMNWYFQVNKNIFKNHNIYLIDLIGHGQSDDFDEKISVNLDAYIDVVRYFISSIIREKPVVISHSFGCLIAKELFSYKLVKKVIYLNPSLGNVKLPVFIVDFIRKALYKKKLSYIFIEKIFRNRFIMKIWSNLLSDSSSSNFFVNEIITIVDMLKTKPIAFWLTLTEILAANNVGKKFQYLSNEEYLIITKNDSTIPRKFFDALSGVKSDNVSVLDCGGHCSSRTIPKIVNSLILEIINKDVV